MKNTPPAQHPQPTPETTRGRVLVADNDPTVTEVVIGYLHHTHYAIEQAGDRPAAPRQFADCRPDLITPDLTLPTIDGIKVHHRTHASGPVPVIMLTARGEEEDRILGLETGADDYGTKPFSPRELVLRVDSVLRRARAAAPADEPGPLSGAGLSLDPAARQAYRDGRGLALTLREFDLPAFLLRHPGKAFGREELMRGGLGVGLR